MNKNPCDDPEACVTQALMDSGRDKDAFRLFLRQANKFLHDDWPTWQRHIDTRIDRVESTLTAHITREQELPGEIADLSQRHDDDMAAMRKALTGTEGPWDDIHDHSPIGVMHRIRRCFDRIKTLSLWAAGLLSSGSLMLLGLYAEKWVK